MAGRSRYIWREDDNGKLRMVQVSGDYTGKPRHCIQTEELIYGKAGRMFSKAAADKEHPNGKFVDVSTKTRHREYLKANGLTMMADYENTWKKQEETRERFFKTGNSSPQDSQRRREAIARSLDVLGRRKP